MSPILLQYKKQFGYIKIKTCFQGLGNETKEINLRLRGDNEQDISFVLFPQALQPRVIILIDRNWSISKPAFPLFQQ